jgi:hypothetical protein
MKQDIQWFFNEIWKDYCNITPQAPRIHRLLVERGERVVNDHIALRTFNAPDANRMILANCFCKFGYQVVKDNYQFEKKNLTALHLEHPDDQDHPKVFISELNLEAFSDQFQKIVGEALSLLPNDFGDYLNAPFCGRFWHFNEDSYFKLKEESEYGAWLYAWGFRANHFTVSVNHLKTFESLQDLNAFLKSKGFRLNDIGGEIKGNPEMLLEQSSTLADQPEESLVPSCYYEFARRYHNPYTGRLFQGFHADSADKIFESTDNHDEREPNTI